MSLQNLVTELTLDVYDHDKPLSSIKAIALDDNSRYINARLTYKGMTYSIDESSTVTLTVLRPDKVGVSIEGSVYSYEGEEGDSFGAAAELDQAAIVNPGTLLGQFKIESGDQLLRTELFKINTGRALDGETSEWAGQYQGYNLDEIAEKLDLIGTIIQQAVIGEISLDDAILETHNYIERRLNERICVKNNGIYISTT